MGMQPDGQPAAGSQRLDFAQIGKVEVLSTGALRIPAVLGRVGVLKYQHGGKTVRELRPPDEVFRADSMATFRSVAATDLHPPRAKAFITPENWKEHSVGYVEGDVRQDGDLLRGNVVVQDAAMIRMIQSGERRELSPGYLALSSEATPGRYDSATGEYGPNVTTGVEYDVVQRGIFNNSMGIGPRGWGRQGSAVALRLDQADGGDEAQPGVLLLGGTQLGNFLDSKMKQLGKSLIELAQETGILAPKEPEDKPLLRRGPSSSRTWILESILDGWTSRPSDAQLKAIGKALDVPFDDLMNLIPDDLQKLDGGENLNPKQASTTMDTIDLHLDGLTASSVPKPAADIINKVLADRDSEITALKKAASENEARLDGVTEKLATADKALKELPGQLETKIAGRAKLEGQAISVLGTEVNLDGKQDRGVQELVLQGIAKAAGRDELKLDGRDDPYVAMRYEVAMEDYKPADATATAMQAIGGGKNPKPAVKLDAADEPDPPAARAAMVKGQHDAWKPATAN